MFLLKFRLYFATGFSAALYHSQFLPISIYLSLSSAPTIAEAGDLSITQLYIYSHCSSIAQKIQKC